MKKPSLFCIIRLNQDISWNLWTNMTDEIRFGLERTAESTTVYDSGRGLIDLAPGDIKVYQYYDCHHHHQVVGVVLGIGQYHEKHHELKLM
jgi:hypothetical protein